MQEGFTKSMSIFAPIASIIKKALKKTLQINGFELRKVQCTKITENKIPPLYEELSLALYETRGGKLSSFMCPVEKIVDFAGFGFGKKKWHPFVEMIKVLEKSGEMAAKKYLEEFYLIHQPHSAAKAFLDFTEAPSSFNDLPPHMFNLIPWTALNSEEVSLLVERWVKADNAEHGIATIDLTTGGFPTYGPVSKEKQTVEFNRLMKIRDSIIKKGYDRKYGDCSFVVLKRGNDYRYIVEGGGYHRVAVLSAIGFDWIPGRIHPAPFVIDTEEVQNWPQVRLGVWSKKQALAYVDYLFDYNSKYFRLKNFKFSYEDVASN